MKKLVSLTLTLVMILSCLSGLALAAGTVPTDATKPIAIVTTGTASVECKTVEEIVAAVDKTGNSVIAVQQDFAWTEAAPINLPYSCTIDFGGHTVITSEDKATDAFIIRASGSENNITTLQNGTLLYARLGLRIMQGGGGFALKNMVVCGINECLSPDDGSFVGDSYVENSILISKEWGPLAFNWGGDCTKHTVYFKDSTLISLKGEGCPLLDIGASDTLAGTVDLGTGVVMYTRRAEFGSSAVPVTGEEVTKAPERATYENTDLGVKLDKLNKFTTAASAEQPAVVPGSAPAVEAPGSDVPATGVSVLGLGILAAVSAAGAALTLRKKEN